MTRDLAASPAVLLVLASMLGSACHRSEAAPTKAQQAAKVVHSEEGPPLLELSAQAVQHLGLELGLVERRPVARRQHFPAVLVCPPAGQAELVAPFAARVLGPSPLPLAGARVEAGQELARLEPLFAPERELTQEQARVETLGALAKAEARLEAAQVAHDRAGSLLAARAGSQRALDEARAELEAARAEAEAGRDLLRFLDGSAEGTGTELMLTAPLAGNIVEWRALPDQVLAAGTSLGRIEDHATLWARVSILASIEAGLPPGDARMVARDSERTLGAIAGLPSADPATESVDRWFEVPNPDGRLRPGQRIEVELARDALEERLVVPASALLFDSRGATWVYVTAPGGYRRAAVDLERQQDGLAVLARGPEPGTQVVTMAAAELFGTEFGSGK